MVDLNDFMYIGRLKKTKRYMLYCDSCNKKRGYGMKSRSNTLCKVCAHKGRDYLKGKRTLEYREKMSKAKSECKVWNKGISLYSKEQLVLRCNMSSAIRGRLFNRGSCKKGESYLKKVGYSIEELKKHLEGQFQEGMTWDNYGLKGWHIDHKTPDSWFTYSSMDCDQFKESWSLSNLQPKWAKDNLSKGNRYED